LNKQKSNIGTWLFDHLDILSAALVGIILYGNTLSFKLVWDDLHLVAYVNDIYKTKGVWGLISSAEWGHGLFQTCCSFQLLA